VLERIGDNAYRLDLPLQLGIHDVLNVNNLKLFESSLLEEVVPVQHLVDNILDFQPPLLEDTILEQCIRQTRSTEYISYLVGRKGDTLAQARWISADKLKRSFPHLVAEAGDASTPNREELGHMGIPWSRAHHDFSFASPRLFQFHFFCHRVSVSFVVVCSVSKDEVLINKVYKIVARLGLGASLFWAA
jgi:hypothetical protein